MSLKIRCPHCKRILVAEDDEAGRGKYCPHCRAGFTVPIPVRKVDHSVEVAEHCPKCGANIAPGTRYCPKCHREPSTGRKLSLPRRLRYVKARRWTVISTSVLAVVLLAILGGWYYQNHFRRPSSPSTPSDTTAGVDTLHDAALEYCRRLLAADSLDERQAALNGLRSTGQTGIPVLVEILENVRNETQNNSENLAAALRYLARNGGKNHLGLIASFQRRSGLREVVLVARGRLGDRTITDDLLQLWETRLRRLYFLRGLGAGLSAEMARMVQTRESVACEEATEALRTLAELHDSSIVDQTLSDYWDSWCWLGQKRGEFFSASLFELAQPPTSSQSDFRTEIRSARDRLGHAAENGAASVRAAAILVLTENAPQYRSLRERTITSLAALLPTAQPEEQQRIAWTLSRLSGQSFGGLSDAALPIQFNSAAMGSALRWAARLTSREGRTASVRAEEYPSIPHLHRRVVTARRQLEDELLGRFSRNWTDLSEALDRWIQEKLGVTPRITEILNPSQQKPDYLALAGAILIAAESGDKPSQHQLELWIQATDQPAWVRGFAAGADRIIEARTGNPVAGWPRDLTVDTFGNPGQDAPPIDLWGRLLAAGGEGYLNHLEATTNDSPPEPIRSTLLRAARQAASRRSGG